MYDIASRCKPLVHLTIGSTEEVLVLLLWIVFVLHKAIRVPRVAPEDGGGGTSVGSRMNV